MAKLGHKIKANCNLCGVEFITYANNPAVRCHEHRDAKTVLGHKIKVSCAICGATFGTFEKSPKANCIKCREKLDYWKYRKEVERIQITCPECGKMFTTLKSRPARACRDCYSKYYNRTRYSKDSEYRTKRKASNRKYRQSTAIKIKMLRQTIDNYFDKIQKAREEIKELEGQNA